MSTIYNSLAAQPSLTRTSLAAGLRALGAVIKKEWLIFVRYPSWIIALIVWPVIFPAAFILGGRALSGPDGSGLQIFLKAAGTDNFLGYVGVGTTIWMWQNIVLWNVGFALREEQMRGTLESNWLSPTWRFSFLLGSSAVQMVVMLLFLIVTAVEFIVFFGVRFHVNPGMVLLMLLVSIPSIYGIGFTFASLVITAKEANTFVFLVRGLVMIFCGITFPLSVLPGWMQDVARWLPPTYILHGLRSALLEGAGYKSLSSDVTALLLFGVFWLGIGYLLFNWMEGRARRTGAIGQY
ncbi:MAG: ABC transporter permease [Omnitrophica WOR_2 bacterium]